MASQLTVGLVGIVKEAKPIMKDGAQEMWESSNGSFYKWYITIDDKKGTCLSKEAQPWYMKEGVSVVYTLETKDGGKYGFKGFKKPESADAQKAHMKDAGYPTKGEYKSTYNDPAIIAQLAMTNAQELTVKLFKEIGFVPAGVSQLNQNVRFLFGWLMKDPAATRDVIWTRIGALKAALEAIPWLPALYPDIDGKEKITTKLIKMAEEFFKSATTPIEGGQV